MIKPYAWEMWDKDDPRGKDESFLVFGDECPVCSEEEQKAQGGDYRGHIWTAIPLVKMEDYEKLLSELDKK